MKRPLLANNTRGLFQKANFFSVTIHKVKGLHTYIIMELRLHFLESGNPIVLSAIHFTFTTAVRKR